MNFLIVDDDINKVAVLRSLLVEGCGILDSAIFEANDAASARRAMTKKDFEIVFLDVLLPERDGRRPSGDTSTDLLREVSEEDFLRRPSCVIGITADLAAKSRYRDEFNDLTAAIFHVEVGNDAWKESLRRAVVARTMRSRFPRLHEYDVCVQTALRNPEMEAFLEVSGVTWNGEERISSGIRAHTGELLLGGRTLTVACAHAPSMGMVAATSLTEKLISRYAPKYLLMTGFCGGIGDDLAMGDLVVADTAWDWQSGKYTENGFSSGFDQKHACADLLQAAREVASSSSLMAETGARAAHVAPMVSGSSVVADQALHQRFKSQHRKVGAVDMEAYGVYYSANYSDIKTSVLCVKGVADLANSEKSDGIQKKCSESSAIFSIKVISSLLKSGM